MKATNNGGHAFPLPCAPIPGGSHIMWGEPGMSLRDYFAAAALQGLLSNIKIAESITKSKFPPPFTQEWHGRIAYEFADKMLEARKQPEGEGK